MLGTRHVEPATHLPSVRRRRRPPPTHRAHRARVRGGRAGSERHVPSDPRRRRGSCARTPSRGCSMRPSAQSFARASSIPTRSRRRATRIRRRSRASGASAARCSTRFFVRLAAETGGCTRVPRPREDLADAFEDVGTAQDDEPTDEALLMAIVPAARPLARWLRSRGALGERRLARLVEDGEDLTSVVVGEACEALPAATLRVALRLALLRPPRRPMGTSGPSRSRTRAARGQFREPAWTSLPVTPAFCKQPAVVRRSCQAGLRRALSNRRRSLMSESEIASDHAWLSKSLSSDPSDAASVIEVHHHAVEAGDLERARATARYYGADLRLLAFRLGRVAAATGDAQKFLEAAAAYRVVIDDFDATDAYAWEYYAFNLARGRGSALSTEQATEVEHGYERARQLAPQNPLFHGRLVGFRTERGAYDRAASALARSVPRDGGLEGLRLFRPARDRRSSSHGAPRRGRRSARRWRIAPPERDRRTEGPRRPRTFGTAAGRIEVAEDFDAPLADFGPYEKK